MGAPLDGILVADFSRVLAGPSCTMTLADLGATVVKIERPGVGDDTRTWGPPWVKPPRRTEDGPASGMTAAYFDSVNRSKRSVTLDLLDDGDRALAVELARRADVLIENFRPETLDKYGLSFEQVRSSNPGIIYASLTGFGRAGGAELLGYDFLVQAASGLMSVTGEAEGEPHKVGVALVDVLAGKDATIGILAALASRTRHGEGCRVEIDLLSSCLAAMANQGQAYLTTGMPPGRMGNAHPSIAPYETLQCRDGLLALACGNDIQFARLVAELGDPQLATDPRFSTNAARVEHRGELVPVLEGLLETDEALSWEKRLTDAKVPAGRVGDLSDGFALAQRLGLEPVVHLSDGADLRPQVRHPVRYHPPLTTQMTCPPDLGANTEEVRAWLTDFKAPPLTRLLPPK
ncbi:CaiB/BaiF CoA transferase family protein [Segeticoccus rhizosphaerae]|uniref:CaiB/BaiF CoA transferase family protein n=1 Tax=Segeticoccus rhizosphaerae TaxID=1104777 RepID=UPI0012640D22|nr:CoA transferase [Segeticoccus rhizosphaerae]